LKLDLQGDSIDLSARIKFSVIILCLGYVLFKREGNGKRDLSLVRAALFFTLISDFTILFLDEEHYIFGVLSFVVVQLLYGIRLDGSRNRSKGRPEKEGFLFSLLLRAAIQLTVTVFVLLLLDRLGVVRDGLLTVTVFYFVCLVSNVIHAILVAGHSPRDWSNIIFAAGLLLFLLCDINVGLFNLTGFVSVTGKASEILYSLASILMWTFYAPSQVLIAISSDKFRQK
jgi:uncharacterized membrane protein YhhN